MNHFQCSKCTNKGIVDFNRSLCQECVEHEMLRELLIKEAKKKGLM